MYFKSTMYLKCTSRNKCLRKFRLTPYDPRINIRLSLLYIVNVYRCSNESNQIQISFLDKCCIL